LGRIPRVTKAFARTRNDLHLTEAEATAVGSTAGVLAGAESLPAPGDVESLMSAREADLVERLDGRRVLSAWVRRVKGRRLWVWYLPRTDLELLIVTRVPPVPLG